MLSVLQWFIGLGSTVFLPIIIFILGIIFGVKPAKAAISGFTVGIGSIGLNLVIGLLSDNLGTAIQVMGEHYGVSLNIMDIGCGVGGPLAFSTTLGMIVGFLAKYDFAKAAQLGMATGAVMKIMPKMVAMFMEGLMPIAEAAKEFANKRLGGRSVNIGMDAALTVGHSTVMSTNLLMVPISLALAIILPGNQTLPFGDLAFYAFGICLMIPIFRGNVVRSIVGCSIYMVSMLYLSTWLAPIITNVFKIAHYNVGTSGQVTSVLCGIWPAGLFAVATKSLGNIGLAVIGVVVIALLVYVNKIRAQKEN